MNGGGQRRIVFNSYDTVTLYDNNRGRVIAIGDVAHLLEKNDFQNAVMAYANTLAISSVRSGGGTYSGVLGTRWL